MSAGAATDNYHHLQLRIPGWLLLLVLVSVATIWGTNRVRDAFANDDDPRLHFPARVTALETSFEGQALTVTVMVEGNQAFEPSSIRFTIRLDDRSEVQASGREVGAGAWHGRSYVFAVERLIPEGRTPTFLTVSGANGVSSVALTEGPR